MFPPPPSPLAPLHQRGPPCMPMNEKRHLELSVLHELPPYPSNFSFQCAHCGKEAYFYCCWNTSYCNSQCQDRHWPSHMATCLQSNSQTHSLAVQQQVRQQTTAFSFPVQVAAAAASNNTNNGRHPASVILTTNGTVRGGASNNATASVFVTTNGTVFRS